MPYARKEDKTAQMRRYRAAKRAAQKFAKQQITELMKLVGFYDKKNSNPAYEKSKDGFIMLNDWLRPAFIEETFRIAKRDDWLNYSEIMHESFLGFSDVNNPVRIVHCAAYYFAKALSLTDGRFALIAYWIRDLEDNIIFGPSDFLKSYVQSSYVKLLEALKNKKPLPPSQSFDFVADRLEKRGKAKEYYKKKKGEKQKSE